jgi:hypothetical protein
VEISPIRYITHVLQKSSVILFQVTGRPQFEDNLYYLLNDVCGCNSEIGYSLYVVKVKSNFAIVYKKGIGINL